MEMSTYVTQLRTDLAAAAAAGGPDVARAGELLAHAVEPSLRLVLLDVLGAAGTEISELLDVDLHVRLDGRDPQFAVTTPAAQAPLPEADDDTARVTLRLPESLKSAVEAAAITAGTSVNSYLVGAVRRALEPAPRSGGGYRGGRITGFAQT